MRLEDLYSIISQRKKEMSENSYVSTLIKKGDDAILQKIGEEMSKQQQAGGQPSGGSTENKNDSGNVRDADFEEKKDDTNGKEDNTAK